MNRPMARNLCIVQHIDNAQSQAQTANWLAHSNKYSYLLRPRYRKDDTLAILIGINGSPVNRPPKKAKHRASSLPRRGSTLCFSVELKVCRTAPRTTSQLRINPAIAWSHSIGISISQQVRTRKMASPCISRAARCLASTARGPIARKTATATAPASSPSSSSLCRRQQQQQQHYYHSYDHPSTPPFGPVDREILAAAYKHVPEHGFSLRAIGLGARDAGYPDISSGILPDGQFSLIHYHLVAQRERLADRSRELLEDDSLTSVGDKVAALTWERLLGNRDIIHRWQEVSCSCSCLACFVRHTHTHWRVSLTRVCAIVAGPGHHGAAQLSAQVAG